LRTFLGLLFATFSFENGGHLFPNKTGQDERNKGWLAEA